MRRPFFSGLAFVGLLGVATLVFAWPVPDTGQTTCYDEDGFVISCAGTGQDGEYSINPMSFTKLNDNGDELPDTAAQWAMVRDNVTGLIWEAKTDDSSIHDKDKRFTWYDPNPETNGGDEGFSGDGNDTQDFIYTLNEGSGFGGYTDWRLPTAKELRSIAVYQTGSIPSTDNKFFKNTNAYKYWSSSFDSNLQEKAWFFSYFSGYAATDYKSEKLYVRAVRGAKPSSTYYLGIDQQAGTVTDTNTGLMWRETTDPFINWEGALSHCLSMVTARYNDWRLPTEKELFSIAALHRHNPSIDRSIFTDTISTVYWSSSTHTMNRESAWGITFFGSDDVAIDKSDYWYVRAVRGGQILLPSHLFIFNPTQASKWSPGCPMEIQWDTQSIPGNVEILLATDGGIDFSPIATGTPNDGHYSWTVTGLPSVNCVLKIVPLSQPDKDTSVGLFSIVNPDGDFPEILSIVPDGPTRTNASSISFSATFSETVFHLQQNHFTLATTGDIAGAAITGLSGIGDTYTIEVGGISGDGTVGINFIADCLVKDNDAFPVTNDLSSSAVTIDHTPPEVQSIGLSGPAQTAATQVQFLVDFGESVQGVDASDFRIVRTGSLTGGTVSTVQFSLGRYIVTVSGYIGLGNLGLELIDDDSIVDTAGNLLGGIGAGNGDFTAGDFYEIALEPDILVSPSSLDISEPDGAATFTVSLSRRPAAPVAMQLSSANRNECVLAQIDGIAVANDPREIVLDAANWSEGVSVTIAARDDFVPDGDRETRIAISNAVSRDDNFERMETPDPTVTVRDFYPGMAITDVYPATGEVGIPLAVTVEGVGFGGQPAALLYQDFFQVFSVPDPSASDGGTRVQMTLPAVAAEGAYDILICNGVECTGMAGAVSFLDAEAAERMKRKKAVVVAGTGPRADNALWSASLACAERAYRALIAQGFTHDTIQFLSAGGPGGDVDETATRESLEHAVRYWAKARDNPARPNDVPPEVPADELLVYLTGHGNRETFRINDATDPSQSVTAGELAGWFHALQYEAPAMPGKLIFVYDACFAGSFLLPLAHSGNRERYVVASVPDETPAYFMDEGEFSFSAYFWEKVRLTGRLYRAFVAARDIMALGQNQHAMIDIDGDGLPDSVGSEDFAADVLIGRGRIAASDPPEVGMAMAGAILECERSLDVWVSGLEARYGVQDVWAVVHPPPVDDADPSEPRLLLERISLWDADGDRTYEGRVTGLTRNGEYRLLFYAKDLAGVEISAPARTTVVRNCEVSMADAIYVLKVLVGIDQAALDSATFDRIDVDGDGKLGLVDALETLRLVGEL